jgi:predicted RNA-binding Zn ribbon-like protein
MSATPKTIAELERLGGHPALDFVNTIDARFKDTDTDCLRCFEDVVNWHVFAQLVPARSARALLDAVRADPRQAEFAFRYAIGLREALYRIFRAVARDESPAGADLDALNAVLSSLRQYRQLTMEGADVKWSWRFDPARPESILGPVAESAAELLTCEKLGRVKECPGPDGCGWLFLDTSRNRSRHWCSMRTCGNPAKVRRFRKKHR